MNKPTFKEAKPGQRPSASEHNKLTSLIAAVANSLHIQGYADSSGFHTRRSPTSCIRKAYCKDDAGVTNMLDCYLDVDINGTEISVACSIAQGGTALNAAVPLLLTGDLIFVRQIGGVWYCTDVFNPFKECTCVEP